MYEKILYSDIIIINKIDLVSQERLDLLEAEIRDFKPEARILKCCYGQVPLQLISSSLGWKDFSEYF